MPDEASPTYSAIIDLMTEGHQFILREFGSAARPRVGWSVDPFGHSAGAARLYREMGFDAFGITRMSYLEKNARKLNSSLEVLWRSARSLGEDSDIFTYMMDGMYGSPSEIDYASKQVNADPRLPTYGVDVGQQADAFVSMARTRHIQSGYRTPNLLLPFGNDFQHTNAIHDYMNMDRLVKYVTANSDMYNITVSYGDLYDYVTAVNSADLDWQVAGPNKDFMVYTSAPHEWWSGYFTSRPTLKGAVRAAEATLRNSELLAAQAMQMGLPLNASDLWSKLDRLRQSVAVTQHHDAITGTEQQAVTEDYLKLLAMGLDGAGTSNGAIVGELLSTDPSSSTAMSADLSTLTDAWGNGTNTSAIVVAVSVYNSLGWMVDHPVVLPVNRSDLVVRNASGVLVPSQINPAPSFDPDSTQARFRLFFTIPLPALSGKVLFLSVDPANAVLGQVVSVPAETAITLENDAYALSFAADTGLLANVSNKASRVSAAVKQEFSQYLPATQGTASGAYLFRPASDGMLGVPPCTNDDTFGPPCHNTQLVTFSVADLARNITGAPVLSAITATVYSQSDVYGATPCLVGTADASNRMKAAIQVGRLNNGSNPADSGWGEGLPAYYLFLDDISIPTGSIFGTAEVPVPASSRSQLAFVTIVFPEAFFSSAPVLIASVRTAHCNAGVFTTAITSLSPSSATVAVQLRQMAEGAAWEDSISLDWVASMHTDATADVSSPTSTFQAFTATLSNVSGGHYTQTVDLRNVSNVPTRLDWPLFATVQVDDATLSVTSVDVVMKPRSDSTGYDINIHAPGKVQLPLKVTVNWMSAVPAAVQWNVLADPALPAPLHATRNALVTGPVVNELQQEFRPRYGQSWRLWHHVNGSPDGTGSDFGGLPGHVEIVGDIGPLDVGRELVSRFTTSLVRPLVATTQLRITISLALPCVMVA